MRRREREEENVEWSERIRGERKEQGREVKFS
jgi:hypothetical protein